MSACGYIINLFVYTIPSEPDAPPPNATANTFVTRKLYGAMEYTGQIKGGKWHGEGYYEVLRGKFARDCYKGL